MACAHALLEGGASVQVLDAGLELEPERARVVAAMSQVPPRAWTAEQLAVVKEHMASSPKGVALKRLFGSDFPYRGEGEHLGVVSRGSALRASLALGGFSNVWGALLMPYRDEDLVGWPLRREDWDPHYASVLSLTGLAARRDDLEPLFPLHDPNPVALQLSRQAAWLESRMQRRRAQLARDGIRFGSARLAVRAARAPGEPGCVYCGLCMYGCPYGYIFNSSQVVARLQSHPRFAYQPGVMVRTLRETGSGVVIEGEHRATGAKMSWEAERVYLAGGVIPSTKILLQSQGLYDHPLRIKDSQYFLLPLGLTKGFGGVREEALYTLSQLFVEVLDPRISPFTVQLQIYTYNDLITGALRRALGPLAKPLEFLVRQLEGRLVVVQGYLHSEHSGTIAATLRRGQGRGPDPFELVAETNPETRPRLRKVLRKLYRHAPTLGAWPISPLLQVASPGHSYHCGGTFPLRATPGPFESDLLGRPHGWQRVHLVDGSTFPSIPATTFTFTVMANAHRIGALAAELP